MIKKAIHWSTKTSNTNWCDSTNMSRLVKIVWYDLIQFLKHVQTCWNTMIRFDTILQTCPDLSKWFDTILKTCWDLSKTKRWWNTQKFEWMTDKVTHDYKAIPRTAFDKRAVKNRSLWTCELFEFNTKSKLQTFRSYRETRIIFWNGSCTGSSALLDFFQSASNPLLVQSVWSQSYLSLSWAHFGT